MSYEICGMPLYALYYYGKACALRPHDTTMWCAMAECYEANDNVEEAIKCLKRAECNIDKGLALVRLAKVNYHIHYHIHYHISLSDEEDFIHFFNAFSFFFSINFLVI